MKRPRPDEEVRQGTEDVLSSGNLTRNENSPRESLPVSFDGSPVEHCSCTASLFWQSPDVKGCPPTATMHHSADVVDSNQMFIFGGGKDEVTDTDDLYVLNTDKMMWRQLQLPGTPSKRSGHATAVMDTKLFVHGGQDEGRRLLGDLHVLDTETLTWTELSVTGYRPLPRCLHTLSRVHDKLYLFGGDYSGETVNTIEILDFANLHWKQPVLSGKIPKARASHSMTVVNSSLVLFGGFNDPETLFNDLHVFNTLTLTWTQPKTFGDPPPGLSAHSATLIGGRLFVLGGFDVAGLSTDLYILKTAKFKWVKVQEVAGGFSERQSHSAFLVNSTRLFIFGGWDGTKTLNDLHVLDVGRVTDSTRNLVYNLKRLLGHPDLSDVTLVVDGHDIPAHRSILVAQCDYFRMMLSSQMKESKQNRIPIQGWRYEPYMALLKFLYSGCLCKVQDSTVYDVMGLSDLYGLDHLKALCERIVKKLVNSGNVCSVLKIADKYQAANLKKICYKYILEHADEVSGTEEYESLSCFPALLMDINRFLLQKASENV